MPPEYAPDQRPIKRPRTWSGTVGGGDNSNIGDPMPSYPPGYLFDNLGRQVCGYWNYRREKVCADVNLYSNGRCKMHGGRALYGAAHPCYIDGRSDLSMARSRYNPYLPDRLLERFEAAESDPELLSARSEISLITARIQEVIEQLDEGESGQMWADLQKLVYEYRHEVDGRKRAIILADIFENISEGASQYQNWQEIVQLSEVRRKMSESEQKRMVAMRQYITAEQATLMVATVSEIVLRNVHDPTILGRIRTELAGVFRAGVHPAPGPAVHVPSVSS
jgi:hypothetical protein